MVLSMEVDYSSKTYFEKLDAYWRDELHICRSTVFEG